MTYHAYNNGMSYPEAARPHQAVASYAEISHIGIYKRLTHSRFE